MSSTNLTIGGFTQPGVARSLIELPANSEKGLSSHFLWFFPNPLYGKFANLGKVDETFVTKITTLFKQQWKRPSAVIQPRVFQLDKNSVPFQTYYNEIQSTMKSIAGTDDFITGMLSKSRGQVLRVAAVLHTLFSIENDDYEVDNEVSERAIKAAVNFVRTGCQQAAYIAGRGSMEEEIEKLNHSGFDVTRASPAEACAKNTAGYCLTLPGRKLYLTPLLAMKKFRKRGNKDGALTAFYQLQAEGLGKLLEVGGSKGASVHFEFEKMEVPETKEAKLDLIKKLGKYSISLSQYERALTLNEIKPVGIAGVKRKLTEDITEHQED